MGDSRGPSKIRPAPRVHPRPQQRVGGGGGGRGGRPFVQGTHRPGNMFEHNRWGGGGGGGNYWNAPSAPQDSSAEFEIDGFRRGAEILKGRGKIKNLSLNWCSLEMDATFQKIHFLRSTLDDMVAADQARGGGSGPGGWAKKYRQGDWVNFEARRMSSTTHDSDDFWLAFKLGIVPDWLVRQIEEDNISNKSSRNDCRILEGLAKVWYAGPRCSLMRKVDSGEQIFLYNDIFQPLDKSRPKIGLGSVVKFTARYFHKYIHKHKMDVEWEALSAIEEPKGGARRADGVPAATATPVWNSGLPPQAHQPPPPPAFFEHDTRLMGAGPQFQQTFQPVFQDAPMFNGPQRRVVQYNRY